MPINTKPTRITFSRSCLFQDPFEPAPKPNQEILDCFEPRSVSQQVQRSYVSLKKLDTQKDSLRDLTASELIHFWNNLGRAKKEADLDLQAFYGPVIALFSSKTPEEYYDAIVPKLCEEVTDRFISGRSLRSEKEHLLCILNNNLKSHIVAKIFEDKDKVFERYQIANHSGIRFEPIDEVRLFIPYIFKDTEKIIERYQAAQKAGLRVDPNFAIDLFQSRNVEDIINLLKKMQQLGVEHRHLFLMPNSGQNFLHQLFREKTHNHQAIAQLALTAQSHDIDIESLLEQKDFTKKTPLQYTRDPDLFIITLNRLALESLKSRYNTILEEAQIDPKFWFEEYGDLATMQKGYRLGALKLHPDKGAAAGKFNYLVELAEALEIKT